jgi:hypothetical protein
VTMQSDLGVGESCVDPWSSPGDDYVPGGDSLCEIIWSRTHRLPSEASEVVEIL